MRYFTCFFLLFIIGIGLLAYGPGGLLRPIDVKKTTFFIIQKGDSTQKIAANLRTQKIIQNTSGFFAGVIITKALRTFLKHGEYSIEPKMMLWQLLDKISRGNVVVHYITIPEGLTVFEISQKLKAIPILVGDTELPPEGTVLPQTYDYYWGESRQQVLQRMTDAMNVLKKKIWPINKKVKSLKDWNEALTLASIIEKETSIAQERPLVASVYINRLNLNMPLQADPTVIYAVTHGKTSFYRPISKTDLSIDSPYNTYLKKGLPPRPIACPGEASIIAALDPAQTNYLYFVANSAGGHYFSENLKMHNKNVQLLRNIEKQKKALL